MLVMLTMAAEFTWNRIEQKKWSWLSNKEVTKGQNQNRFKRVQRHLRMAVSQRFPGG